MKNKKATSKYWLRIDLVQQAASGHLTASQVAQGLGVSVRQVRRLIATLREKGPEGLLHSSRGKVSPVCLPQGIREKVIRLLETEYADYSTAQARDALEAFQHLRLSYSALYRLRRAAGTPGPRRYRSSTHRTRWERAEREGLLLQADGSPHDWLEGRGPRARSPGPPFGSRRTRWATSKCSRPSALLPSLRPTRPWSPTSLATTPALGAPPRTR